MDKSINSSKQPLGRDVFIYTTKHHGFGTDAVILSDFANAKKRDKVVDIGTGCGIIPFLMLRDGLCGSAVGVDISKEATDLAEISAKENNFTNFCVLNSNILDIKGKLEFGKYNLVTCNPPYKAPNAGIKNTDMVETVARHETECTMEDIVRIGAKLLQTGGRLCMCQRPERMSELLCLMSKYGVEPKRLRLVIQRVGEKPWLFLVEGRRSGNIGLDILPPLFVEKNGDFSEEMKRIYGPYKEGH